MECVPPAAVAVCWEGGGGVSASVYAGVHPPGPGPEPPWSGPGHPPPGVGMDTPLARPPNLPMGLGLDTSPGQTPEPASGSGPRHHATGQTPQPPPGPGPRHLPLVNRMTDMCKNITFANFFLRAVINESYLRQRQVS